MISSRFRSTLAGILVAVACGGESLRESDAGGGGQGGSGTGGTRVKPTPGSSGGDSASGGRASAGEGSGGQASETGGQPSESTAGQGGEGTAGAGGEGGQDSFELPPCPNPMVFEDPGVESGVRLRVGDGPIGPELAASIDVLDVQDTETLVDLRCFPAIEWLYVYTSVGWEGQPVDLTGLSSLSHLEELFITVLVTDPTPLGALQGLSELTIWGAGLTEIPPLPQSGKLNYLDLRFNEIVDASGIATIPSLETVLLSSNAISDLTSLAETPYDYDLLDLTANPIDCEAQSGNLAILVEKGAATDCPTEP